jgi:hypothetical protein
MHQQAPNPISDTFTLEQKLYPPTLQVMAAFGYGEQALLGRDSGIPERYPPAPEDWLRCDGART